MSQNIFLKGVLFVLGSFILILGIALILRWWVDVMVLFRAGIGMALTLAGLLILYSLGRK